MDDVVEGQVISSQPDGAGEAAEEDAGRDAGGGADMIRIYAEVSDLDGARVWLQDAEENELGESEDSAAFLYREQITFDTEADADGVEQRTGSERGGAPHLDAENALVLGEALLQFARQARGGMSPPVVPVARLAVAIARAVELSKGARPGSVDSEVLAQAILDDLSMEPPPVTGPVGPVAGEAG